MSAASTSGGRPASGLSAAGVAQLRACVKGARLLVVGSLNMDYILRAERLPENDGSVVSTVARAPGGHAGNCASALAALGAQVTLLAAVGQDGDGDALLGDLAARGVDVRYVERVPVPTGRVFIPTFPERRFMLMSRGANEQLSPERLRRLPLGDFHAVIIFDPSRAAVEALPSALPGGAQPLLCWNPGGIYSTPAFLPLARRAFDLLIVNRDEYRTMFGGQRPGRLPPAKQGHETVVTLGEDGSQLYSSGASVVTEPAYTIDAQDLTGAGDAYCAAMVLGRLAGLNSRDRLRFANVVGGLATRAPGARGSLPGLAEAIEYAGQLPRRLGTRQARGGE